MVSYFINVFLISGLYYLNEYVYASRFTYIQYNDIYSISDALRVASNYPLIINLNIIVKFSAILIITVFITIFYIKYGKSEKILPKYKIFDKCFLKCGISSALLSGIFSFIFIFTDIIQYPVPEFGINLYTNKYSLVYALIGEYKHGKFDEPENYSETEIASMNLDEVQDTEIDEPVDIVVIMNEAFTDYSLCGEVNLNMDPLSEIHSYDFLQSGKLCVSVYGGATANTEFEFLTGLSLAYFPQSSVPYSMYIKKDTHSLCTDLKKFSYTCTAIHPYYAEEYRRESVYNFLGFDDFISGEDFSDTKVNIDKDTDINSMQIFTDEKPFGENNDYYRGYISDAQCYEKISEVLESNKDKPNFVFAVTVQNHGIYGFDRGEDYIFEDFTKICQNLTVTSDFSDDYFTCSHESSRAFAAFLNEIQNRDKKTIVVMFGDHHPSIDTNAFLVKDSSDLVISDKTASDYIVPYYIMTNFTPETEIDTEKYKTLSPNYLSLFIKEYCNIPKTNFDNFRYSVMEEYPAITVNFFVDKDGNYILTDNIPSNEKLTTYENICYYETME